MTHPMPRSSPPRPERRPWSAQSAILIAGAAALGLAVLAGVAFGYLVGTRTEASCSPTEMWCELGAAMVDAAAGFIASVITYVVVAIAVIYRLRPEGQRSREIASLVSAPVVLVALLSVTALVLGS